MGKHNDLGENGEALAKDFLENKGYAVLERNWRYSHKEVDLIARKGNTLVFIEVKTRTGDDVQHPEVAVNKAKQRHLVRAAEEYMSKRKQDMEVRFDVIAIVFGNGLPKINHFEDAFFPV